jgi:DNA-binding GntR family transcriptional regulator
MRLSRDEANEPGGLDPIAESLTTQVYNRLRGDLITGLLRPELKLKVDALRRHYGFGASPIREALSLLTSEGLVERHEQRGFRVAKASLAEFDDILEIRCWIEARALTEAIECGDRQWENAIVLSHHDLSRLARAPAGVGAEPSPEWELRHKAFHMSLLAGCRSPTLRRFADQLYDRNVRYRRLAGPVSYPTRNVAEEHAELASAAIDRDAGLAVARLVAHYRKTSEFLRSALASSTLNIMRRVIG